MVTMGDGGSGEMEPYVVKTGQPVTWYVGILVIFLVASAVVGWLFYDFGRLAIFGAVAGITGIVWSAIGIFQSTQTEWGFSASGIAYRETGLLKTTHRHIAADDIEAVGVETQRRGPFPNPMSVFTHVGLLDMMEGEMKRKKAGQNSGQAVYRLAFRLRNGEVMKIDREYGLEAFQDMLENLRARTPRVTWPVVQ